MGIFLIVLAKNTHRDVISDLAAGSVATGFWGMLGNKGGVGIRFRYVTTVGVVHRALLNRIR